MAVHISDSAGKFPCILIAVINSGYQTVFKCDPAPGFFKIITAGFQNLIHAVFVCDRHQFPSLHIIRCVKRKCKCHLKLFFCKVINLRNQPTGRYSQVSLTDMKSSVFCQDMYKPEKIFIIIKRFPRSHDHNIGNSFSCQSLYPVYLIQHF